MKPIMITTCMLMLSFCPAQHELPNSGVRMESEITFARALAIEKKAHASFGFPAIDSTTIRWLLFGRTQSVGGRQYSLNTPEFSYTIESTRGLIRGFYNKKRTEDRDKRKNRTQQHLITSADAGKSRALEMLRAIGAPQPLEVTASRLSGDQFKRGKTDHDNLAMYHIFVKNAEYGYVASIEMDAQDGVVLHFLETAKPDLGWNRRQ